MPPEVQLNEDFRTLGLNPGAGASEVKKAYRGLVKKWHPDRHHLEPYEARAFAEDKFLKIDEAYRRIAKTWEQGPRPGPNDGRDFSRSKPGAKKWGKPFGFNPRGWSAARFFPGLWPIGLSTIAKAALLFVLILLYVLISNIAPDRPVSVKMKLHLPAKERRTAQTAPLNRLTPPETGPSRRLSADFFTLGSSDSEVLKIQGTPSRIQGETWVYGVSEVNFKNGRVTGYNNFDRSLRVRMEPGAHGGRYTDHITIGSTQNQVLQVQGTPTRIAGNRWYYGFAELTFENGLLRDYDNYFGTLKISLLPSTQADHGSRAGFFTQGSTPDEVVAAQGTPSAVHGKRWSYNFDYVFFRDGKVSGVIDSDGALHYVDVKNSGAAERP